MKYLSTNANVSHGINPKEPQEESKFGDRQRIEDEKKAKQDVLKEDFEAQMKK